MKLNRRPGSTIGVVSAMILAVTVLGLVVLRPTSVVAGPARQTQSDMDKLRSLTGQDFEIQFMSMMIMHHTMAITMAQYAATNANHQEVKDAAQTIIASQAQEISQMTGWLKAWYNATPIPNAMTPAPGMGPSDIMNLGNLKGDDFDKQFLSMMIMHHTSAIEMAQLAPDRATHQELKTLAQNVISSQTSEKQEFTGWLKAWYNIDASQPAPMPVGMPSTGGSDGTAFAFWLAVPLVLAGSILMGGLVVRRRS
ncbi:MAG: DUF305 domain-containing protein [Chloroflexi bacterium]|nr:DUF305 domain-containing protein [Chloroflexota bacterium]